MALDPACNPCVDPRAGVDVEMEALARAAATAAAAPLAFVVLGDGADAFVAGDYGYFDLPRLARECCLPGTVQGAAFLTADATTDRRVSDHPLVTGAPFARALASLPIQLSDGVHAGCLVVLDPTARAFGPGQRKDLVALARVAGSVLDARRFASLVKRDRGAVARPIFEERLADAMANARDQGHPCALLLVDMDIADLTRAQSAGVDVLPAFGARLMRCVRPEDSVGMLDHGLFAILLRYINEPCDAAIVKARVEKALAEPFAVSGHRHFIGAGVKARVYHGERIEAQAFLQGEEVDVDPAWAAMQAQDARAVADEALRRAAASQ